jgi:hypothetical protein
MDSSGCESSFGRAILPIPAQTRRFPVTHRPICPSLAVIVTQLSKSMNTAEIAKMAGVKQFLPISTAPAILSNPVCSHRLPGTDQ